MDRESSFIVPFCLPVVGLCGQRLKTGVKTNKALDRGQQGRALAGRRRSWGFCYFGLLNNFFASWANGGCWAPGSNCRMLSISRSHLQVAMTLCSQSALNTDIYILPFYIGLKPHQAIRSGPRFCYPLNSSGTGVGGHCTYVSFNCQLYTL